jgi:hypothetical protein
MNSKFPTSEVPNSEMMQRLHYASGFRATAYGSETRAREFHLHPVSATRRQAHFPQPVLPSPGTPITDDLFFFFKKKKKGVPKTANYGRIRNIVSLPSVASCGVQIS